ncbi:MAG: EF-P lysine aminoacylase EpmA [Pseudomonadales bacterium]|nr:EF-P lysine aminoacylase EpmA [Pseudomonadales bacterium]
MIPWRSSCSLDSLVERARVLGMVRNFFRKKNVLEVQTAILARYGVTEPTISSFRTDSGHYLQTSPEFQMKRLLAAGAPSIYQICPAFRQGEEGRNHNPEFVILEWYRLGFDSLQLMHEVAELVDLILGLGEYQYFTVGHLLEVEFNVDVHRDSDLRLAEVARDQGLDGIVGRSDGVDFLVATAIRRLPSERVFVTKFPVDQAALAKTEVDGEEVVADRFELVINGIEVANGYHELTDADELQRRMDADNRERENSGLPILGRDPFLLASMREGLPACAGVAVGLDRLLVLAGDHDSLSEVMAFPFDRV